MRAVRNGTIGASDARLQADELHDQVREGAWADHDQIEQEVREIDTAERSETRAAAAERRQANRVVRNAARVVRRQARDRAIAIRRLRRDGDAGESQIQNLMDYGVEEQDAADAVFASSPRFATWSEDARISETRTRRGSPPGPGVWDSDPAGDENEPSIDDSPSESTQDPIAAGPEPVSVTATQGRLIEGAPQRPLLAAGSSDSSLTPVRLGARAVMMRPAIARVSTGTAVFRERVATRVGQAFNHLRFQSHRGSNIRIVVRPDSSPGSYTLLSPDLSSSELAEIQRGIANGAAGSDGFRPAVAINTVFATAPNARGAVVTLRIGRTGSVERASYEARE